MNYSYKINEKENLNQLNLKSLSKKKKIQHNYTSTSLQKEPSIRITSSSRSRESSIVLIDSISKKRKRSKTRDSIVIISTTKLTNKKKKREPSIIICGPKKRINVSRESSIIMISSELPKQLKSIMRDPSTSSKRPRSVSINPIVQQKVGRPTRNSSEESTYTHSNYRMEDLPPETWVINILIKKIFF